MKKIILLLCIVLSTNNLYAESIDTDKYDRIIHTMLNDLSEAIIIGNKSKNVEDVYNVASECFNSQELHFTIDLTKKTILNGMSFDHHIDTDQIDFSYGLKFLDTYKKGSSIHLSILMHEMRHLYDYKKNRELFLISKTNPKEGYWFELDAMHIEAEFIKNYLSNYNLSLFEMFLSKSFDQDNLDSISIFLKKERMNIFFYFNSLEKRYFDNKKERNQIFTEIVTNGNDWIEYYNKINKNDEYNYFFAYISVGSYQKFMMSTIATLLENPTMTWSEVFNQYPKIENLYNQMRKIIEVDNEKQMQYLQEIYKYWEDDIMKKISA